MFLKTIPATILGVILGTQVINLESASESESENEDGSCIWFGFVPNEKGMEVFPSHLIELLSKAKQICGAMNWSIEIHHASGSVNFVVDDEGEEWYVEKGFPDINWKNMF